VCSQIREEPPATRQRVKSGRTSGKDGGKLPSDRKNSTTPQSITSDHGGMEMLKDDNDKADHNDSHVGMGIGIKDSKTGHRVSQTAGDRKLIYAIEEEENEDPLQFSTKPGQGRRRCRLALSGSSTSSRPAKFARGADVPAAGGRSRAGADMDGTKEEGYTPSLLPTLHC